MKCSFWATHHGVEIDLLIVRGAHRLGVEIKLTEAPGITPSIRIALNDLRLDRVVVIHAGQERFPLAERVEAVPIGELDTLEARRLLSAR